MKTQWTDHGDNSLYTLTATPGDGEYGLDVKLAQLELQDSGEWEYHIYIDRSYGFLDKKGMESKEAQTAATVHVRAVLMGLVASLD